MNDTLTPEQFAAAAEITRLLAAGAPKAPPLSPPSSPSSPIAPGPPTASRPTPPALPALPVLYPWNSPQWRANMAACRNSGTGGVGIINAKVCPHHRRGATETCAAHDGADISTISLRGACRLARQPHRAARPPVKMSPPRITPAAPKAPPIPFASNIGRDAQRKSPPAEAVDFPIDLVYLWVDGSDPVWQASYRQHVGGDPARGTRFASADELKYSLRSVERFAPWVNHVYIVTAGQTPAWLDTSNPKVTIVDHARIIDPAHLPTFNSQAIECHIHNIPGLSEHFLYANDDMLLGAPVQPGHFFTPDGRSLIRLAGDRVRDPGGGTFARMKNHAADMLDSAFGVKKWKKGWHHIKPYRRSMMEDAANRFPDAIAAAGRHRLRCGDDVAWNCGFWPSFSIEAGYGIETTHPLDHFYVNVGDGHARARMAKAITSMPHVMCLNNGAATTAPLVKEFLEAYLPARSSFEDRVFTVGAKIGDLVYAMATIRHMGGGRIAYRPATRQAYRTDDMLGLVSRLVDQQPYVRAGIRRTDAIVGVNLESWRGRIRKRGRTTLASVYAQGVGAADVDFTTPWIEVDQPHRVAEVIINRTARYQNPLFPWRRVLEQYAGRIAFVGTRNEHAAFVSAFGHVPYHATVDMLDVARAIAGSELFIGNQSSAYAIAEAMKVNTLQEVCTKIQDCLFDRPNATYGWDGTVTLPKLGQCRAISMDFVAQHGEDRYLQKHWQELGLPAYGTFVDVGAGDPKHLSNSWWLEKNGWRGVLVEANEGRCMALRAGRRSPVVHAAVGRHSRPFVLNQIADHSGLERDGLAGERVVVPVLPLSQILDAHGISRIDLISIDVEGSELEAWGTLDKARHRPHLVIMEFKTPGMPDRSGDITATLQNDGYRRVDRIGGNLLFIDSQVC